MNKLWKDGVLLSVVSSLFSSISVVFAVAAAKMLNPIGVAGFGALIAGLILFIAASVSNKKKISWDMIRKNKRDLAEQSIIRGFIGHGLLLVGYSMTQAVKAVFFTKIEPFFVLLWGQLLGKEKLNAKHIFIIAIHLTGVFLLSTGGALATFTSAQLGDGIIIFAVFLFAYTYYSGARLAKKIGARATVALSNIMGGSMNTVIALLFFPLSTMANPEGWLYLLGYLLFFHVIALTLWYAALKTAKGWVVSAVRALGPLTGMVVAFALFGEVLTQTQAIGGAVILITSILIARER
jgi:drug/metabolite transporter (DMT)-like permease